MTTENTQNQPEMTEEQKNIAGLAQICQERKQIFLDLRRSGASYETLTLAANDYADALAKWHKAKYPNKRFSKPRAGYLIRAL